MHGFASGPSSSKARFFQDRFAQLGIGLEIPDLAEGNFEGLTITGQLNVIERTAAGDPVSLIGSSMGGYLAALYAARHPEVEKLVLLAPAFSFPTRWPEEVGEGKMEEWRRTGVLFQGKNDTVVPPIYAANWAEQHPEARLRILESDHQLLNVLDEMWMETEEFLFGSRL